MKLLDSFSSFVLDEEASFSTFWIESCFNMAPGTGASCPQFVSLARITHLVWCADRSLEALNSLCKKAVFIPRKPKSGEELGAQ